MKRKIIVPVAVSVIVCMLIAAISISYRSAYINTKVDDLIDLGIPYQYQYGRVDPEETSLIPWDMKMYDEKLYVSAGDGTLNTGPVELNWYDTNAGEWTFNGYTVLEETIFSFTEMDGVLTIAGSDASADGWEFGNYYQLRNGVWEQYSVLPDARHCFDLCRFGNRIFAATGTTPGLSPLLVSNDNGKTFEHIPLVEKGLAMETSAYTYVRGHLLFEQEDTLYALIRLTKENATDSLIARYEPENDWFTVIGNYNNIFRQVPNVSLRRIHFVESSAIWRGVNYFANGRLVRFENNALEICPVLKDVVIWDLLVYEDCLYLLGSNDAENPKRVEVYKTDNGVDFERVLWFVSDMSAVSFEMDETYFYFGMANPAEPDIEDTGKILAVDYTD